MLFNRDMNLLCRIEEMRNEQIIALEGRRERVEKRRRCPMVNPVCNDIETRRENVKAFPEDESICAKCERENSKEERRMDKLLIAWDESDLTENEVKFRLENKDEFGIREDETEDDIRKSVLNSDFLQNEWEFFTERFKELIHKLNRPNKYKNLWNITVKNFGWRNLDGHKTIEAKDGKALLSEILPNCDCTFKIFSFGRKGIKIQNFHHDSPSGNEWYFIRPLTKKESISWFGDRENHLDSFFLT